MSEQNPRLQRARSYVLWLLARRDYPQKTLEEKLKKKELTSDEIKNLLNDLIENGLYNEKTYKELRTRQLIRRGYGPIMIQAKMRKDRLLATKEDIQKGHLSLNSNPEEQLQMELQKLLRRYASQDLKKHELRNKLFQSLQRKGFLSNDILKAIQQTLEKVPQIHGTAPKE